jgi:DNA transformation protein
VTLKPPKLPGDPFVRQLLFSLEPLLPVRARAMFGGWGIYHDGKMFALVAAGVGYLKADDQNRPQFEAAGLGAFTYAARGKTMVMAYREMPPGLLADPLAHREWLDGALEAAQRQAAKKPARRKARQG